MARNRLPLLFLATLALGLGGCQYLPWTRHWAKITLVPANAPQRSAAEAEDALYARAVAAIDQRDYGLALDVLQLARERRANDPRVLTAMGVVYDKLGRFDLSHRYYDLAEAADPGSKVVAIDRAYSLALQQRRIADRPAEAIMLAESPPATIMIAAAKPMLPPLASKTPTTVLVGHPVRLLNATGEARGADPIQARLAGKGWRVVAAKTTAAVTSTSQLQYPPTAQRAATGLARTLSFPVRLNPCATCTRMELVIGTDAISASAGRQAKARRG